MKKLFISLLLTSFCLITPAIVLTLDTSEKTIEQQKKTYPLLKALTFRTKTIHPLVVHFPIALLTLAFPLYLLAIILKKESFKLFAITSAGLGFLGALISTFIFHPHTFNLSEGALVILRYHDLFAEISILTSGLATTIGTIKMVKKFKKVFIEIILLAILFCSFISIGMTGHMGGLLVYKHGIGIEGKYLK
jgi:uncharacterized membrane protein